MQALILAGGEATRLRPLTSTIPKPVVPLVNRPFITYMLQWLQSHGVDEVILSCGFMAEGVRRVLGDGSQLGIRLRYVEEPQPLGTAGALKFAEQLLEERFWMLNGDVLTDIDLDLQLEQHEQTDAQATLALVAVEDPSAYGLVRCAEDGSVTEFVEKPTGEQREVGLVNAGVYVLERGVLDHIAPAPAKVSIEREVFPCLVGAGLYGYAADGYWLDIGTPERYLQASFDILEGSLDTELVAAIASSARAPAAPPAGGAAVDVRGEVVPPVEIGAGSTVGTGARVGARAVIGCDVSLGELAEISTSVLLDGVRVGAGSVITGSIIGPRVQVGQDCRIEGDVVLGEEVRVGAGNVLSAGARIFPGVSLPERTIRS